LPTDVESYGSISRVDDHELVERAVRGDASAFEELVYRHGAAVYRAALAALRSSIDAEDVMQDAFLLAYRKLSHFRGDASFKTWLLTITWRCALRRRQSPARRLARLISNWGFVGKSQGTEPSAEHVLIGREMQQQLRRLIRALPSRLRDPFLLAASGRYSYEELSDILDVPTGTLKWRVSEARRLLRGKLQRLGYTQGSGLS
jgi:RNA polymerase sigma-70 factor, ECF subfamily